MSIEKFISLWQVSKRHLYAKKESTHDFRVTEPWSIQKGILIRKLSENILLSCSR